MYWEGHEDLIDKLIPQIVADIQSDTGANPEDGPLYAFWKLAFNESTTPRLCQVLTPY